LTKRTRRSAATRKTARTRPGPTPQAAAPKPTPPENPASRPPRPANRLLRGYAFDPSLATQLETALVSGMTYTVPWEPLKPGPIGEYVEVVDYDPPSNCFYAPVDLDDPAILAQNGLQPSEGNPQFHQQMVYAVTMTTINRFERALGRKALWSDRFEASEDRSDEPVLRLRVYPHAMRTANAYYSRSKRALLFGYFPATEDRSTGLFPGGMTFSCLSHDIIAHETTHALLDGFHEYFLEQTNPDVLAFHEAFADIVALFQHFTFPEVLAHQIGRTGGDLRSQNLLAELATQFGHARGSHGALRDAIGQYEKAQGKWVPHEPDPTELERKTEVHARGAILVAAVFDAFLSIYDARSRDLLRLAAGGRTDGRPGVLHPDLVNRLAVEASKAARHVLTMCIRALDYCPPVDLTFGDYLRALITADIDLMPEDGHRYRVAFIEAFRRRGIYPRDVRTLSEDSLRWARPGEEAWAKPGEMERMLDHLIKREQIDELRYLRTRESIWRKTRKLRASIHIEIKEAVDKQVLLQRLTGLVLEAYDVPPGINVKRDGAPVFSVYSLREARRERDDGVVLNQVFITLLQKLTVEGESGPQVIRCGSTLVVDLNENKVAYSIAKRIDDTERIKEIVKFKERQADVTSLAETYFGANPEPFAALHLTGA
jgi:hypothetical protein